MSTAENQSDLLESVKEVVPSLIDNSQLWRHTVAVFVAFIEKFNSQILNLTDLRC